MVKVGGRAESTQFSVLDVAWMTMVSSSLKISGSLGKEDTFGLLFPKHCLSDFAPSIQMKLE